MVLVKRHQRPSHALGLKSPHLVGDERFIDVEHVTTEDVKRSGSFAEDCRMSKDATWAETIGCHFAPPFLKEIVLQHVRIVATFGTVPSNQNKALGVGTIRECVTSKAW